MSALDFVKNLNPMLERREVLSAISDVQNNLNDFTLPVARDLRESFSQVSFKTKFAQQSFGLLSREIRYRGNGVAVLCDALVNLHANLEFLEGEVKKQFSPTLSSRNVSYTKASILRYIELAGFYVRYFRKFFLRIVADETAVLGRATPPAWSRAEREWLETNLRPFMKLYPMMAMPQQELKSRLSKGSDAEVDPDTYEMAKKSLGSIQTDPLQMNFLNSDQEFKFHPIFSIGKVLAEMSVSRYKAAKEERTVLQLRLEEYRSLQAEGVADANLQRQIQYTEKRVEGLDHRIERFEQSIED